jgi:anti-sigma-K factor RskA
MTDFVRSADLTHEDATELAGLYVLDALLPDEKAAVDAHLAGCNLAHPELAEAGAVAPALAALADPLDAPPALKSRVMSAYHAEVAPQPVTERKMEVWDMTASRPHAAAARRSSVPSWLGWAAAAAAVLGLVFVGAWGLGIRGEADRASDRAAQMTAALAALSAPDSSVAVLRGTGTGASASGFAAFPKSGGGYVVLTGLPSAPSGKTYQAWFIADGAPQSAGLMTIGSDGYAIVGGMQPIPGTKLVALTVEPAGGSDAPTSDPIVVGTVGSSG